MEYAKWRQRVEYGEWNREYGEKSMVNGELIMGCRTGRTVCGVETIRNGEKSIRNGGE